MIGIVSESRPVLLIGKETDEDLTLDNLLTSWEGNSGSGLLNIICTKINPTT